jgi:hypothetical protein
MTHVGVDASPEPRRERAVGYHCVAPAKHRLGGFRPVEVARRNSNLSHILSHELAGLDWIRRDGPDRDPLNHAVFRTSPEALDGFGAIPKP